MISGGRFNYLSLSCGRLSSIRRFSYHGDHTGTKRDYARPCIRTKAQDGDDEGKDLMDKAWAKIQKKLAESPDLSDEEKRILQSATADDVASANFIREAVGKQLGPILSSIGITEDPYDFFIDLLTLASFIQFVSIGMLFYASESLGYNQGEAFRIIGGLFLGYFSRPFVKIEQFISPLYNLLLKAVSPNTEYVVERASDEAIQSTVNKLGVMIGCGLFLPQLAFGQSLRESLQIVGPATVGLILFDIVYAAALLIKIEQDQGSGSGSGGE